MESDIADQSFLEKESGADKEFEMDKLNHKRGTDLDLKAFDSILDPDDDVQAATKV